MGLGKIAAGGWDWERLQMELPSDIKMVIQATLIPLAARIEDKLAWKLSSFKINVFSDLCA